MGGCRCVFRNCTVGTAQYPKMHFFRFPYRDQQRLLKWIEMADKREFLKIPLSQLKNKAVCARHFRDDCFMNYLRDKLVATAVPTLNRVKGGLAVDYDTVGNIPIMIQIPPTQLPHMMAPKDFPCPLFLDECEDVLDVNGTVEQIEEFLPETNLTAVQHQEVEKISALSSPVPRKRVVQHQDVEEISTKSSPVPRKRKESNESLLKSKKPKILNFKAIENSSNEQEFSFSIELQDDDIQLQEQEQDESVDVIEILEEETVNETQAQIVQAHEESTNEDQIACNMKNGKNSDKVEKKYKMQLQRERKKLVKLEQNMMQQINELQKSLDQAYIQVEASKLKFEQIKDEQLNLKMENQKLSHSNEKAKSEITSLLAAKSQLQKNFDELNHMYDATLQLNKRLEGQNKALQNQNQQVSTVSTSKNPSEGTSPVPTVSTKAQLFNGIKKYLSSSMVALVRMEMFGSTERAWKPDEKQAALDLFGLGENVYRYFTDEWRFRLPGVPQVKEWFIDVKNATLEEDEEDL